MDVTFAEVWHLMNACPYFISTVGAFELQVQVNNPRSPSVASEFAKQFQHNEH